MLHIRRVNGPALAHEIYDLQAQCLPEDTPCHVDIGWWWLAYDDDTPIAFASVCPSKQAFDRGYFCRSGVLVPYRGKGLQKRLIRARLSHARKMGWASVVSDTCDNVASSNSLISCGFKLYTPEKPWSFKEALYWRRKP